MGGGPEKGDNLVSTLLGQNLNYALPPQGEDGVVSRNNLTNAPIIASLAVVSPWVLGDARQHHFL